MVSGSLAGTSSYEGLTDKDIMDGLYTEMKEGQDEERDQVSLRS